MIRRVAVGDALRACYDREVHRRKGPAGRQYCRSHSSHNHLTLAYSGGIQAVALQLWLANKLACGYLTDNTHNLKLRINQLPPLPNLTLSQKLNKYKVNATTYTRGNHCLACNISQSGQQRSGICGSFQQSSCQLPSIRYY